MKKRDTSAMHWRHNQAGGLTRLPCEKCREETIHRGAVCIHCGNEWQPEVVFIDRDKFNPSFLTAGRRKRARVA